MGILRGGVGGVFTLYSSVDLIFCYDIPIYDGLKVWLFTLDTLCSVPWSSVVCYLGLRGLKY